MNRIFIGIFVLFCLCFVSALDNESMISYGGDNESVIGFFGDQILGSGGIDSSAPGVVVNSPSEGVTYGSSPVFFNVSTDENATCNYSLNSGVTNFSMTAGEPAIDFTATKELFSGSYVAKFYCVDEFGNLNDTESVSFGVNIVVEEIGGGGGGGGGASVSTPVLSGFEVDKFYDRKVAINRIEFGDFTIKNIADETKEFSLSVETLNEIIILEQNMVTVNPNEEEKIGFSIHAPQKPGIYTGKIIVSFGSLRQEVLLTINVKSEKSLFDIMVTIPRTMRTMDLGENLRAQIDLIEMGLKDYKDVTLVYEIKDFGGNVILTESETVAVADQKTLSKEFFTENFVAGEYILAVELIYPEGVAVASSHFNVKEPFEMSYEFLIMGVVVIVLLGIIIIIFLAIKRYKRIGLHTIKKR